MRATKEATERFFQNIEGIDASKVRLFDGLRLSALGIGAHLGSADEATDRLYEKVLLEAVQSGVNAFDTALIDREMRSEKLLGRVVEELASMGISREALFLTTKGGYLLSASSLEEAKAEAADVVREEHCMSPAFLEHQIETSLSNLKVDTIDLYWLHNPEVELWDMEEELFYERLKATFSFLEKMVAENKIARYGLASWSGFRARKKALQIKKIAEIAEQVAGPEHHCKALFFPLNLVMLEVLKNANQAGKLVFPTAEERGFSLFASSPLMQGQVLELPDHVFERLPLEKTACLQALQFVLSTPGLTGAFLSVKQTSHWEEVHSLLNLPGWSAPQWKKATVCLGLAPALSGK